MHKTLKALVCAAMASVITMPLVASGVKAETAQPLPGVGNQHVQESTPDCTADFWITESPTQSVDSIVEPAVTSLTVTASLSCNPDVGYLIGSVSLTGPTASCSGSFSNFSGDSASASCTLTKPVPGVYNALAHVYAGLGGWVDFTWSSNEIVLPSPVVTTSFGTQ